MTASLVDEVATSRYWQALEKGDRSAAVDVARELLERGRSRDELLLDLVCPAQLEVGRRWAANEWSVAREHIATSISEDVIASLAAREPAAQQRGVAVVTCVEGEWHALPARVLSETLRLDGWQVNYLGASVPAQHLAQFVQDVGPDVVALSCSVSTSLPRARQMIEAARQAGVPVVAGGRGFGEGGVWATLLGADGWAPSAATAVTLLDGPGWPSYTTAAPPYAPPDEVHLELVRLRQRLVDATATDSTLPVDDVGSTVDFLAAAVYVDDPGLFSDFVGWLVDVLAPRGVPVTAVRAHLGAVREQLAAMPRAQAFVDAGLQSLRDGGQASA